MSEDKPILKNYELLKSNHGNSKKPHKYKYDLDEIAGKVLNDVDAHDIPLLNQHGLLVWHRDVADRIPNENDLFPIGDRDSFVDFLESNWQMIWINGRVSVSPDLALAYKTNAVGYGTLQTRLTRNVEPVEAIEMTPHYPSVDGAHYLRDHTEFEDGDGTTLDKLVEMLNAGSPEDRDLMKAMILTSLWGGDAGDRPLFVLKAETTGCGKSETAKIVSRIVGGHTLITPPDRGSVGERLERKLGTAEETIKRVYILDNFDVDTVKDSALEAYISSSRLPLDRLYHGSFQPPNLKVAIMTLNTSRFSKDLADRSVVIQMGPKIRELDDVNPTFSRDVKAFIDENREALICDILGALRGGARCELDGTHTDRWSDWAEAILTRFDNGNELYGLIHRRRASMDSDSADALEIVDLIKRFLGRHGIDPETTNVCIPTQLLTVELAEHFGERNMSARTFWAALRPYEKTDAFRQYGLKAESGRDTKRAGNRGLIWKADLTTTTVLDWETAKEQSQGIHLVRSSELEKPAKKPGSASNINRSDDGRSVGSHDKKSDGQDDGADEDVHGRCGDCGEIFDDEFDEIIHACSAEDEIA